MSPRDSFWFLAGALISVAILMGARAWLKERPAQRARAAIPTFAVPIAAALALIGAALGIYFLLGSPDPIASDHAAAERGSAARSASTAQMAQSSANAGSLDEVTSKLAARLAANGGSDGEWNLLAQSYDYMGRTADAKAARAHIASGEATATGNATAGAVSGGQMAAIADALDAPKASAAPTSTPSGTARISGIVEIVSKLAPQALAGVTLFIYAKQPNAPGPPLAVLRVRADHWPVTFTLNDDNAMIPGRNLSNATNVQLEARISRSGDALPRSGDLVGTLASVNPHGGQPVRISIDRQIG
jgi:hypothetical protein